MSKLRRCLFKFLAISFTAVLQACVFIPRTVSTVDAECQVVARKMILQEVQIAAISGCANQGCVALVAGAGVVAAATILISGSVVIAGNLAYWLETKADCLKSR